MKDKKKEQVIMFCNICRNPMTVGLADPKHIVAMCTNEQCLSTFVFGDPVNKVFIEEAS